MLKTAKTNPTVFFATCARLIPQDVKLTVEQKLPGNLSMEDWQVMKEIIAAVRQAIPDAASAPPGAVLEHVLGALGAAQRSQSNCQKNGPVLFTVRPTRMRKSNISRSQPRSASEFAS
jgi:hypothetical protein